MLKVVTYKVTLPLVPTILATLIAITLASIYWPKFYYLDYVHKAQIEELKSQIALIKHDADIRVAVAEAEKNYLIQSVSIDIFVYGCMELKDGIFICSIFGISLENLNPYFGKRSLRK